MTPEQLAKLECANYDRHGRCYDRKCRLATNESCAYFEEIIIPLSENQHDEQTRKTYKPAVKAYNNAHKGKEE